MTDIAELSGVAAERIVGFHLLEAHGSAVAIEFLDDFGIRQLQMVSSLEGAALDILRYAQEGLLSFSSTMSYTLGAEQACIVNLEGEIRCWGRNNWGQLIPPAPNEDFVEVGVGHAHTCGRKSTGEVVCWGYHDFDITGQIPFRF